MNVTRKKWDAANTLRAHGAAEVFGVLDPTPPAPGLTLVGWTWEHKDGSVGLVRPNDSTGHREQPVRMRPVWA